MLGLVLSGGLSSRMGSDKGAMVYPPSRVSQRMKCFELLKPFCEQVYISCREEQRALIEPSLPLLIDSVTGGGPGVGILSAARSYPGYSWLVLACDFPFIEIEDTAYLAKERSLTHDATCFLHSDGTLEPLFSIWETKALDKLGEHFRLQQWSPRKALNSLNCKTLKPLRSCSLKNMNTPLSQTNA